MKAAALWDFREGVSTAATSLVRQGVKQAMDYFAFPAKNCETMRVAVTITNESNGHWAASAWDGNITIYGGGPYWAHGLLAERYASVFHEWYHLVQQELMVHLSHQWIPDWLIEGTAEWMGYRAAADLGYFPSFAAIRSDERDRAREIETPLQRLAGSVPGDDSYAVSFVAVDFLDPEPIDLLRFWRRAGSGWPWKAAFKESFGISANRFYERFDRYRSRGFV